MIAGCVPDVVTDIAGAYHEATGHTAAKVTDITGAYHEATGHTAVRLANSRMRMCKWCHKNNVKTKSGWKIYSTYMCSTCKVPLCCKIKRCFQEFHDHLWD